MRTPRWAWLLAMLALVAALFTAAPAPADALENGRLPGSALSPINADNGCNQLANRAAAAHNTAALLVGHGLPTNGCDSAYRSLARQAYWRAYWCGLGACGNSAVVGTSNHGWGLAEDLPPSTRAVYDHAGGKLGFWKPCSDAPGEVWHYKFCNGFTRPNPGTDEKYPILRVGSGGIGQHQWVLKLQEEINQEGVKVDTDGEFGGKTETALKTVQRRHRIATTGASNRATWVRLLNSKPSTKPTPEKPNGGTPAPAKPQPGAGHHRPTGVRISNRGVRFIASFEGFVDHPYNDPVGFCTIGYGHLLHHSSCTGADNHDWGKISKDRGEEILRADSRAFQGAVRDQVNVALKQPQFDALVSFSFNVGAQAFADSTLLRLLNDGKYGTVPGQLNRWVHGGGQVLPGLVRRRAAEGELFARGY